MGKRWDEDYNGKTVWRDTGKDWEGIGNESKRVEGSGGRTEDVDTGGTCACTLNVNSVWPQHECFVNIP